MATPHPPVGFATARDGLRIAFTRHGRGPPLMFVRGWIGQLDIFWSDPEYRAFFERLGRHFTVYRFDCRGNGLSGREATDYSWPALVSDIEAVADHESLDRFVLWGSTFGAIAAIRYATRHPARVGSLVVDGAFAKGRLISSVARRTLLLQALQIFPEMAILLLARATSPSTREAIYRRPEIVQQMIAPKTAAKLYGAAFKADITGELPKLSMPVMVMHRRNSQSIPFALGRAVADAIPQARFSQLEGTAHNLWEEDPDSAIRAMLDFLGVEGARADADWRINDISRATVLPGVAGRRLAAILYADLSGYTRKMETDEAGTHQRLFDRMTVLRAYVAGYSGTVHSEAGDALMVEFGSASAAVECAVAFQKKAGALDRPAIGDRALRFRIGVHLGEIADDGDMPYGTAINIAQRLESIAPPGGVCVSRAVYEAVRNAVVFSFDYAGEHAFKHLSAPMEAYNVRLSEMSEAPVVREENVVDMKRPN
jgi:class 3 adenylate cyclase